MKYWEMLSRVVKSREKKCFYLTPIIILANMVAVYFLPSTYPFIIFRWVVGAVFVLYLPGLIVVECFMMEQGFDRIERFTLSVGISLLISVFLGFALSYTPWGVRLDVIIIAMGIFDICAVLVGIFKKHVDRKSHLS